MTIERKNFRAHLGLSDIDAEQSEQAKRVMTLAERDIVERLRLNRNGALEEAAKYLDAHAAWASDELEKASTETAKALWEITRDEAKRHAKIIRALRTPVETVLPSEASTSPSSPEQEAVLREALEKQLRFAIENLEGIRDGTDIPSMVIIRKSRKLLDRLSSSGTQGKGRER